MKHSLWLLPFVVACGGGDDGDPTVAPSGDDGVTGTTLPMPDDDADFDGVVDADDCAPDDPDVYPGAHDAPGDGVDADCDGTDPDYAWMGEWEVVNVQAIYSTYPVLVEQTGDGTLEIDSDGDAVLDASSQLDPELVGADIPIAILAYLEHEGHAAPMARADQVMLYLDGLVSVPGALEEVSYADLLCTVDGDELSCEGTLKALETTLDTTATMRRIDAR